MLEYTENELACLHDVVYNATNESKTKEELLNLVKEVPSEIQSVGNEWGLNDTVYGDKVYVWLKTRIKHR